MTSWRKTVKKKKDKLGEGKKLYEEEGHEGLRVEVRGDEIIGKKKMNWGKRERKKDEK